MLQSHHVVEQYLNMGVCLYPSLTLCGVYVPHFYDSLPMLVQSSQGTKCGKYNFCGDDLIITLMNSELQLSLRYGHPAGFCLKKLTNQTLNTLGISFALRSCAVTVDEYYKKYYMGAVCVFNNTTTCVFGDAHFTYMAAI